MKDDIIKKDIVLKDWWQITNQPTKYNIDTVATWAKGTELYKVGIE